MAKTDKRRAVIWKAVSSKAQIGDDKASLPEQERAARQWCVENGFTVIAVLEVPGYSRSETDIVDALEEFAAQKIFAYHQLREMWKSRAFDVLVAFSHDRFGRSSTLHSWVIENVVSSDAKIYLLDGGWIGEDDMSTKIAIGGISATSDIQKFKKRRKAAMRQAIRDGKYKFTHVAMPYRRVRDERGKTIRIELREEMRPLWDAIAKLLLDGVGWYELEVRLAKIGFVQPSGAMWQRGKFRDLIKTPTFWGHLAMMEKKQHRRGIGDWIYEDGYPSPDNVIIQYNTHEPVYTGEQAQRVLAEIRRRDSIGANNNRIADNYRFTGLVVCGECAYNLSKTHTVSTSGKKSFAMTCMTNYRWKRSSLKRECSQTGKWVSAKKIQSFLDNILREIVASMDVNYFNRVIQGGTQVEEIEKRLKKLNAEYGRLTKRAQNLVIQSADAGGEMASIYAETLNKTNNELKQLRESITSLEQQLTNMRPNMQTQTALEEIKLYGIDDFWQLPDDNINRLLHLLLGNIRMVATNGEIVGFIPAPVRKYGKNYYRD